VFPNPLGHLVADSASAGNPSRRFSR
jgi:hypothetical protein